MYYTFAYLFFLLGATSSCFIQAGKGASYMMDSDTMLLAVSEREYYLRNGQKSVCIPLLTVNELSIDNPKNIRVNFENLRVDSTGEGVYEVYLNRSNTVQPGNDNPNPENLLGSLNLYNLTIPNRPPMLAVRVPDNVKHLFAKGHSTQALTVIVVFRGNLSPAKLEMPHTGQLHFGKVSIDVIRP